MRQIEGNEMPEDAWYRDGLPFQCTQCGNCCTGAPGAVWITEDDIEKIAEHTGESIGEVRLFRTRLIGGRLSLTEFANGDCTYFDPRSRKCRIYPVRPVQCKTWPFWPGNVETPQAWRRTQETCPGSGRGDFVPLKEIQKRVESMPHH